MELLDKEKLQHHMERRMAALQNLIERDYAGNPQPLYNAWWELKKEAIERGEYDS